MALAPEPTPPLIGQFRLAEALLQVASQPEPPLRFAAGADAVATLERKANDLLAQADAYRALSSNLARDDA